jgi:hypothetical protein
VTIEGGPAPAPPGRRDPEIHTPTDGGALSRALTGLRDVVRDTPYRLSLPSADAAAQAAKGVADQLDDYLLPRLQRLDAPLLVVVGGSTGAGKSTLVNSLVRTPVSPAGVLRPTTRAPVLVCHPNDITWFTESHLLPGFVRTTGGSTDTRTLQVVSALALNPGLAFLDAPDIDSVVDANRVLANQLLAAADLWLFVTTAARYADAVPWDLLRTARSRGTAIALVLDRVPAGAADEITPHLTAMLAEQDLRGVALFVLPEAVLDGQGLLDEAVVAELRGWFAELARSASARAAVVRQTVSGAIDALRPSVATLARAADEQVAAAEALDAVVRSAYRAAESSVERGIADGALLRGEVLARWQELVGTGDVMRALQSRIGWLRDRVVAAVTGRMAPTDRFQEALQTGIATLLTGAATDAAEQAAGGWRTHPAGARLLSSGAGGGPDGGGPDGAGVGDLARPSTDLPDRIDRLVHDWQRAVLELVRTEAGDKRALARASAYVVNATGLLLMAVVFTATSFIPTGAEIAVAGGTTVAAQKVLEAIFGDQAVRALATSARADLLERVHRLLDGEAARYRAVLAGAGVDPDAAGRLRTAVDDVEAARRAAGLPAAGTLPAPALATGRAAGALPAAPAGHTAEPAGHTGKPDRSKA